MNVLFFLFLGFAATKAEPLVGANEAKEGKYPFLVSIRYNDSHICSGVILSEDWVLTAGHCIVENERGSYNNKILKKERLTRIHVGTVLSSQTVSYGVDRFKFHPEYFPVKFFDHDLVLIKISGKIKFDHKEVDKAKISSHHPKAGDKVKVPGWGSVVTKNISLSKKQRVLETKVMDTEECENVWAMKNEGTMFCTISPQGEGISNGDSGSPIVWTKWTGTKYVMGIHSSSAHEWRNRTLPPGCCDGRPSFHIKLTSEKIVNWILSTISPKRK